MNSFHQTKYKKLQDKCNNNKMQNNKPHKFNNNSRIQKLKNKKTRISNIFLLY